MTWAATTVWGKSIPPADPAGPRCRECGGGTALRANPSGPDQWFCINAECRLAY